MKKTQKVFEMLDEDESGRIELNGKTYYNEHYIEKVLLEFFEEN